MQKMKKDGTVLRAIFTFLGLGVMYVATGIALLVLAADIQIGDTIIDNDEFIIGAVIALVGYILLYAIRKKGNDKWVLRFALYDLWFVFSAIVIFFVTSPVIDFARFLRFRVSGVNLSAGTMEVMIWLMLVSLLTYTLFTTLLEHKKRFKRLVIHLGAWTAATIVAGYISLAILLIRLGPKYLSECLPKVGEASAYCYGIGEPLYKSWSPVPAIVTAIVVVVFSCCYFYCRRKTKHSG